MGIDKHDIKGFREMNVHIPIDKSIDSITNFVALSGKMSKKRQDRSLRLFKRILLWIALFLIAVFATYGCFMRGNAFCKI